MAWVLWALVMAILVTRRENMITAFGPLYQVSRARSTRPFGEPTKLYSTASRGKETNSGRKRQNGRSVPGRGRKGRSKKEKSTSSLWRLGNIQVPLSVDPGKDHLGLHSSLVEAVEKRLNKLAPRCAKPSSFSVARKSFDARVRSPKTEPSFSYVVDVAFDAPVTLSVAGGALEPLDAPFDGAEVGGAKHADEEDESGGDRYRPSVVVVGAGPAGLFAALALAEAGFRPTVVERGQPVNIRGRDIGALINRRRLNAESNLCFGEGGAGTWSDGKLTTRIGRNSGAVRCVLKSLVEFGAPERILVDGKPHLGTDRMIKILKCMRESLIDKGVEFRFGTRVERLVLERDGSLAPPRVTGVEVVVPEHSGESKDEAVTKGRETEMLRADHVVLAVGHSARDLYRDLAEAGVPLQPKGFAVGFRVEHPQQLINDIQLKRWANLTTDERNRRGYGKVPVADYRLVANVQSVEGVDGSLEEKEKETSLPGARSELTPQQQARAVYSFCMCPGGQIMPTSMDEKHVCVNGMSFSKRSSRWANSALVVTVHPHDESVKNVVRDMGKPGGESAASSCLAGVIFQEEMESRAAVAGGGGLIVPVQRVTDYLAGCDLPPGAVLPDSSYKLGVKPARLDLLYPPAVTAALREALLIFDKRMPGFVCESALLHGVETRTSAPVTIPRHGHYRRSERGQEEAHNPMECVGIQGLWPAGEGAGHAGGIVSAAVDGIHIGHALARAAGVTATAVAGARADLDVALGTTGADEFY